MPVVRPGEMFVQRTDDGARIFTVAGSCLHEGRNCVSGRFYDSDERIYIPIADFEKMERVKVSGKTGLPADAGRVMADLAATAESET